MTLYALLEPLALTLLLLFGLWMGLRKATPKLALKLGEACRKAGLPAALVDPVFGPPPQRSSACGSCCGCDKGAPREPARPIEFFQKH